LLSSGGKTRDLIGWGTYVGAKALRGRMGRATPSWRERAWRRRQRAALTIRSRKSRRWDRQATIYTTHFAAFVSINVDKAKTRKIIFLFLQCWLLLIFDISTWTVFIQQNHSNLFKTRISLSVPYMKFLHIVPLLKILNTFLTLVFLGVAYFCFQ
jgi:hypothetical protein